jgi:hypothetical protein
MILQPKLRAKPGVTRIWKTSGPILMPLAAVGRFPERFKGWLAWGCDR